jgi:tRNA-specific 2-thiouridylase
MRKLNPKKVVVGMSGGVDSSMTLILLKEKGFEPIGVSLRFGHWENEKNILKENVCCTEESFRIARKVCQKIGVEYFVLDAREEFKKFVMDYFLKLLKEKKTPSPCLICNKLVKFKKLIDFANELGVKYISSGHYARVRERKEGQKPAKKIYQLLRAKDKEKDQSYFLALLGQKELSRLIFPLGEYTKKEIFQIAKSKGFDFWQANKQSQDLCFVANESLPLYLDQVLAQEPGKIVNVKGNVLGEHKGLHFFTLGQRKGLNLKGGPFWVVGFDIPNNILIVTDNPKDRRLFKKEILISNINYISGRAPKKQIKVEAKTRFRQELSRAVLIPYRAKKAKVVFEKPQRAPTPGQWLVFYQGDICLGGGMIEESR